MKMRADRCGAPGGDRAAAAGAPTVLVTDAEAAEQVRGFGGNPILVDRQTARRVRVALEELIRLGSFRPSSRETRWR